MWIASSALLLAAAFSASAQTPPPLIEKIEVERIIVDARVTNDFGEPILGLQPRDFRIRIDGQPAEIESVDWISESRDVEQFEDAAHVVNGAALLATTLLLMVRASRDPSAHSFGAVLTRRYAEEVGV